MPIYEYICDSCGKRYERIVLSREQAVACPHCSSRRKTLQLSVFSAPAKSNGSAAVDAGAAGPGACGCGAGGCGCN